MICLALNTATSESSLALVRGDQALHVFSTQETRDQGNTLLREAAVALEKSGLEYKDVSFFAAVTGPGSFTGIRIGLAAARGLALATGAPVLGVSSFELFAASQTDNLNIVAVESWREELYFSVFDEKGSALFEPVNETPEYFLQRMAANQKSVVISGDAQEKLRPLFPAATYDATPRNAVDVARIALKKFVTGEREKPTPYYLRPADVTISSKPQKTVVTS